jgi:hypothetical protein
MLPSAHIVHQLRGRLRLRIREKCQDQEYFEEVRQGLEPLSVVEDAKVNCTTGSILLLHPEASYPELEAQLRELRLFDIKAEPEPERPALLPVASGLSSINQALSSGSAGSFDLRTLAFVGVMGLVLRQVIRGELIGPALPMLVMALNLVKGISKSEPAGTES